jgi:hypothetical protein
MISQTVSTSTIPATNERWRPIVTDLGFWSVAGATVAVFSTPLGQWWKVPPTALLAGGTTFVVVGAALWLGLRRIRPTPRRLLLGFGATNVLLAPALWAVALSHSLPVSTAGNWALGTAGDAAALLGAWQLWTLRRPGN